MSDTPQLKKFLGKKGFETIDNFITWEKIARLKFNKRYGWIKVIQGEKTKEERKAAKIDLQTEIDRRKTYTLMNLMTDEVYEYRQESYKPGALLEFDNPFVDKYIKYTRLYFLKLSDITGIRDLREVVNAYNLYTNNKYEKIKKLLDEDYENIGGD